MYAAMVAGVYTGIEKGDGRNDPPASFLNEDRGYYPT